MPVGVAVGLAVKVAVPVRVGVTVKLGVAEGVTDGVAVGEAVGVMVTVGVWYTAREPATLIRPAPIQLAGCPRGFSQWLVSRARTSGCVRKGFCRINMAAAAETKGAAMEVPVIGPNVFPRIVLVTPPSFPRVVVFPGTNSIFPPGAESVILPTP